MDAEYVFSNTGNSVTSTVAHYRVRFGAGGSVVVWYAIGHGCRTPTVVIEGDLNARTYRGNILGFHVAPVPQNHDVNSTSQRNNGNVLFILLFYEITLILLTPGTPKARFKSR